MKVLAQKFLIYCFSFFVTMSCVFLLTGCATLFEADREPASAYDRGYDPTDEKSNEDDADCVGRFCVPSQKPAATNDETKSYFTPHEKNGRVKDAIDSRDVILGMTRNQVMESWGEPSVREVAGDGNGGHERWHFGSRYSLQGSRILIFENGRVAGWYR